jgi:hypothetical protein
MRVSSSESSNVEATIEEWRNSYSDLDPQNISTILLRRVSAAAAEQPAPLSAPAPGRRGPGTNVPPGD